MTRPGRYPRAEFELLELYDAALPQVYGYLLGRCRDRTLSEDLTAETFLAAAQAVRRDTPPDVTVGWLVGIARHKLVDHWRHQGVEARHMRLLAGDHREEYDPWDDRIDAMVARAVLDELGPHHRAALTLRYLDGLPVPEVAEYLGRGTGATETLLVRARRAFRAAYAAQVDRGEGNSR